MSRHLIARLWLLPAIAVAGVILIVMLLTAWQEKTLREAETRRALFAEVQPVELRNCEFQRFGEPNDGGYLLCGNLLTGIEAGYSYGIAGYDGWGCDVSRRYDVPVHQYDCFDVGRTECEGGRMTFHEECVAGSPKVAEGRVFDTLPSQISRNGDQQKRLVVKMDIEGSEWESLAATPLDVLDRFDQLAMELHGVDESRFVDVVRKLKQVFYVAHLHFNNWSCQQGLAPFPASAVEVLFVNKRIGELDPTRTPILPRPLDAPSNPRGQDCQRLAQRP
jgi:hypothetical protein